jgi:tetratricopeptide (TPR) repeat protein
MTERAAGNLAEAEKSARHALSLRRDPGAYEALALVSSARGQNREAELLALSALRLDEERASTHVTLGLVAYRLGEVGRARAEFDRAAALDPGLGGCVGQPRRAGARMAGLRRGRARLTGARASSSRG